MDLPLSKAFGKSTKLPVAVWGGCTKRRIAGIGTHWIKKSDYGDPSQGIDKTHRIILNRTSQPCDTLLTISSLNAADRQFLCKPCWVNYHQWRQRQTWTYPLKALSWFLYGVISRLGGTYFILPPSPHYTQEFLFTPFLKSCIELVIGEIRVPIKNLKKSSLTFSLTWTPISWQILQEPLPEAWNDNHNIYHMKIMNFF